MLALLTVDADIDEKSLNGFTSLYLAAQEGHVDVIKVLLIRGASINEVDKCDRHAWIFIASQKGHVEAMHTLAEAAVEEAIEWEKKRAYLYDQQADYSVK